MDISTLGKTMSVLREGRGEAGSNCPGDGNGAGAQHGDVLLTLREIPANIKGIESVIT
jgi:hypothetical protein